MSSRAELKARGKASLQGNWGTAIAVLLVMSAIMSLGNRFGIAIGPHQRIGEMDYQNKINLLQLVLNGAVMVGTVGVYLSFLREGTAQFTQMFDGFSDCFVASLIANLILTIATAVGFALLIVPGVIVALMFSQTFYILRDHPDMSGTDALLTSKDLMEGHKVELFTLQLSFIPWFLLCVLVIPALYVVPYYNATMAAYYEELRAQEGI